MIKTHIKREISLCHISMIVVFLQSSPASSKMYPSKKFQYDLMLFGARGQLPTLGVQLGKAAGDVLHASMQQAVLVILCIEIVLVALPLVEGHQCCVLPVNKGKLDPF